MQVLAVLVAPDLLGIVLAFLVDGLRAPIVLFARHVRSAFNEQDAFAAGCETIRQRPAARACADDDHVEMVVHDGSWSREKRSPYKPLPYARGKNTKGQITR